MCALCAKAAREGFYKHFGRRKTTVFFVPGRTELAGNHTDHQRGRVLAAGVDRGITAACAENGGNIIRIISDIGISANVELTSLLPVETEKGKASALVRGMAEGLEILGCRPKGFDAVMVSELRPGGGLSSSAAFSVLVGQILSGLCGGRFTPRDIARTGQRAENLHFGKPSGLMDQMACASGGAVYMDFFNNEFVPIKADFESMGLIMILADTGGSHSGLNEAYAEIPSDMSKVSSALGCSHLAETDEYEFSRRKDALRDSLGVRAVMRAEHFFDENRSVPQMRDALSRGDGELYMKLMNDSGRSSELKLRNIKTRGGDRALEYGLDLSRKLLEDYGAWRVHGGGFAGCVQALMPKDRAERYIFEMEKAFFTGCCM